MLGEGLGRFVALVCAALLLALLPSSAAASVEIGQAPPIAGTQMSCVSDPPWEAFNTSVATGPDYVVPAGGGVITAWRHQAGPSTAPVSMRVYSPQNAGRLALRGGSDHDACAKRAEHLSGQDPGRGRLEDWVVGRGR